MRASVADGAQVPQHLGVGGRGTHEERAGTAHVEGRPVHPGEDGAGLGAQQRTGRDLPGMEPRLGVDDRVSTSTTHYPLQMVHARITYTTS